MDTITRQKLIIDTDAGLDDAQAILMALASKQVEVVAITTVMGNTTACQVAKNVLRILKLADRLDVPVYVGSEKALNGYMIDGCSGYHGIDGFGDCPDPDAPDADIIQKEDGVSALIRLSKVHNGDISVACLGPLTNIATVLRSDIHFGRRLQSCFIMGGNYYGRGNVTTTAEYNFFVDPEAAREVLQKLECPKTLVGWEVCSDHSFPWEWYTNFWKIDSPTIRYLERLEQYPFKKYYLPNRQKGIEQQYEMADQFLIAVILDYRVAVETKSVYADVELTGDLTRGQMVVDWKKMFGKDPNVVIVTKIDRDLTEVLLKKAVG